MHGQKWGDKSAWTEMKEPCAGQLSVRRWLPLKWVDDFSTLEGFYGPDLTYKAE